MWAQVNSYTNRPVMRSIKAHSLVAVIDLMIDVTLVINIIGISELIVEYRRVC